MSSSKRCIPVVNPDFPDDDEEDEDEEDNLKTFPMK